LGESDGKEQDIMKNLKRSLLTALLLALGLAAFSGCRTAHGLGEDVENAGQHIQDHRQ